MLRYSHALVCSHAPVGTCICCILLQIVLRYCHASTLLSSPSLHSLLGEWNLTSLLA